MGQISTADRVRASKLRGKVRVGAPLKPEEATWLHEYESQQEARGASKSRTVEYKETEAASVGTGSAAEVAALAAVAREEGRQQDKIVETCIKALTTACDLHRQMSEALLKRAIEDGQTMRELMISVRTHYLDKAELEADAIRAEAESKDGGLEKLATELLPMLLPQLQSKVKGK